MELGFILLKQILIMFIFMAIGYVLFKKQKITTNGSKDIGTLLIYCVIPIIIIKSFWISYSQEKLEILISTFFISLAVLLISMLISYLFFKDNGVKNFGAAFSNAGFIGIPLVTAVLGGDSVFFIACIIAELNIFQFTYGVFIMTKKKDVISYKKILTNPILISFVIGIFIFLLRIPEIDIATQTMSLISGINTPLAMIISGVYLAQADFKLMFSSKDLYLISLVRLVIIPIATLLFLMILPKDLYTAKLAILIAASAPTGSNVAIYAQQYEKDYSSAVLIVCITTILSIITLPIIISIAATLF